MTNYDETHHPLPADFGQVADVASAVGGFTGVPDYHGSAETADAGGGEQGVAPLAPQLVHFDPEALARFVGSGITVGTTATPPYAEGHGADGSGTGEDELCEADPFPVHEPFGHHGWVPGVDPRAAELRSHLLEQQRMGRTLRQPPQGGAEVIDFAIPEGWKTLDQLAETLEGSSPAETRRLIEESPYAGSLTPQGTIPDEAMPGIRDYLRGALNLDEEGTQNG